MREVLFRMVKFVLLLTILEPNYAFNTLESVPPVENGILTACTGNQIAITCSHNETLSRSTTWNISPPMNCSTIITHRSRGDDPVIPLCNSSMIMFQDVESIATSGTTVFRSTALVNTTAMMSGSVVECRGGNKIQSVNIGNISLCVIGQLPPPADLKCTNTLDGLMITWNNVTDTSCAGSPVKYNITVVRQSDGMVIDSLTDLDGNGTKILNKTSPSIDYSISISARTTIARCDGEKASAICSTSKADKYLFTDITPTSSSSSIHLVSGAVGGAVVLLILLLVVVCVVIVIMTRRQRRKFTTGGTMMGLDNARLSCNFAAKETTERDKLGGEHDFDNPLYDESKQNSSQWEAVNSTYSKLQRPPMQKSPLNILQTVENTCTEMSYHLDIAANDTINNEQPTYDTAYPPPLPPPFNETGGVYDVTNHSDHQVVGASPSALAGGIYNLAIYPEQSVYDDAVLCTRPTPAAACSYDPTIEHEY